MPVWFTVSAAILRSLIACSPFVGFWNNDPYSFNLRGVELAEAKELMDVINSRILLLSWPPLTLLAILAQAETTCKSKGIVPFGTFVLILAASSLVFGSFKISPHLLRGVAPPLIILLLTTVLDIVFQIYLTALTVGLICI